MSKNLIQDIVKKNNHKEISSNDKKNILDDKINSFYVKEKNSNNTVKNNSKYGLWFIAFIALVFLFFAVSSLFVGAKITINPKKVDLSLNDNFIAIKEANMDLLPFDLIIISDEEKAEIQGGEEKELIKKATGIVNIYNAFSTAVQRLDVDTRLEGSNGKIYKTKEKVSIPGIDNQGNPGLVEVEIYATEAGEEYNSEPLDFTIVGFKNSPKYNKFYARSKGEISGGFKGLTYQVSEIEKEKTLANLENILKEKLIKKAQEQIPNDYILFDEAIFIQNDGGSIGDILENNMLPITLKGDLYGFLFEEKKLTKRIIQNKIDKYLNEDIYIPNIRNLSFSFDGKDNALFSDVKQISFNLSGQADLVWKIDSEKLISDVFGKNKKDFNQILTQYSGIDSAELVIKPVWRKTFPEKFKDIKIIINNP